MIQNLFVTAKNVYLHLIYFAFRSFLGCLAEEQFTTKPDANSFAVIGGEFLFNWNYTTDPGVSAEVIQWYQSDALGNVQGVLVMRLITTLKILNANFIGRTIYVPNAGMLVKNITFSDEGYFTCYISYTNGHTHKDTMYLHVTSTCIDVYLIILKSFQT